MAVKPKFDFGGWATKNGIKCTDGRTIIRDAFKHNDGQRVPLVWQHLHNDVSNILGHAILENREEGVYAYCTFNETEAGKNAKEAVAHGDITMLSIYANSLKQKGAAVIHGVIREVSLVLSGANSEAVIDNLGFSHGDGLAPVIDETEAIIYTGLPLSLDDMEHSMADDGSRLLDEELSRLTDSQKNRLRDRIQYSMDDQQMDVIFGIINSMTNAQRLSIYKAVSDNLQHEDIDVDLLAHAKYAKDATVQDVFDTLDETQKTVVYALIAQVLAGETSAQHSNVEEGEDDMKTNVFDKDTLNNGGDAAVLSHAQFDAIMADAKKFGSLKDAVISHASDYGIENIDILFPDAQSIRNTPDIIKREDAWVTEFLSSVYKTPFSRIKSTSADLTEDEARAKGYIKGNQKKEEVFPVLRRTTTPTTIYKKQKLDRDDIIDITDFDVVAWLKLEMRSMLNEELARAALIGDGRPVDAEDKINEQNIRPVWTDDEIYSSKILLEADVSTLDLIDDITRARKLYKGSGNPNLYTTEDLITDMLLVRDLNQRRIYATMADLASALRVNKLIPVEVMEDQSREIFNLGMVDLTAIILNPRDYTMGADKGGNVSMFDDFDIDYNQYKYLIETRCSGALTKPKSAVVIEKKQGQG